MKESNNKPSDSQPIKPAYGASKETSSDNKDKKIVLSGIRSTGNLHLGNYFGALNKFVRMQDDCDCRFFIADLHALTTNPDPKQLHESVKEIIAEYLAAEGGQHFVGIRYDGMLCRCGVNEVGACFAACRRQHFGRHHAAEVVDAHRGPSARHRAGELDACSGDEAQPGRVVGVG